MKTTSRSYLDRLKEQYTKYGDNESLLALADIEKLDERVRELTIYREQQKTQDIIKASLTRYRISIEKLTNPESQKMTPEERAYCFATMDWCKFTLDIVGENPAMTEHKVDEMVESYAKKVGMT